MSSQTHRKIAEHLRALADLFDDLSVEVTARKSYSSHGYITAAKRLGIGVHRFERVELTEMERQHVLAHIKAEAEAKKPTDEGDQWRNVRWSMLT